MRAAHVDSEEMKVASQSVSEVCLLVHNLIAIRTRGLRSPRVDSRNTFLIQSVEVGGVSTASEEREHGKEKDKA